MPEPENKDDVIPKKVCAVEVLSKVNSSKTVYLANAVLFGLGAIFTQFNVLAGQVLMLVGIAYDVFEYQKVKKYIEYLKNKYDL